MAEKQQFTQLQFGFDIRTKSPVDRRIILTYEEMTLGKVKWNDGNGKIVDVPLRNILPDRYIVLCSGADESKYPVQNELFKGRLFIYDSSLYHDEDNYHIPMSGAADEFGLFTMISKAIDVVDSEGNSLADADGVVKIYDPDGSRILNAELGLDETRADIEDLRTTKIDVDMAGEIVDDKLKKYQRRTLIYGSGDELDSEGIPHPKAGTDGFGVHVTVEPSADEP